MKDGCVKLLVLFTRHHSTSELRFKSTLFVFEHATEGAIQPQTASEDDSDKERF
jgi:hypothetical protein